MGQARGHLSVSVVGAKTLTVAEGFAALTAPPFTGLVTALDAGAVSLDSPLPGRLRYVGASSAVFLLQATVSLLAGAGPGTELELRLAVNGATLGRSKVRLAIDDFVGTQSAALQALMPLLPNDCVDVYAQSLVNDVSLTIEALSMLATASVYEPTTGIVSEAALRAFAPFIPLALDLQPDLEAARAFMASQLDGAGLSLALAYQIELRLAAHFAALRQPDGRLVSESAAFSKLDYGGKLGSGLEATFFGQAALALDPTGRLAGAGSIAQLRFVASAGQ